MIQVKHIFATLASVANVLLLYAVGRGMSIGDTHTYSSDVQGQVGTHMLIGLGALIFAALVHAIALTYFIGTGRFVEETSNAYSLSGRYRDSSQRLKYRTLPGMTLCLLLLIATGALGAVADQATPASLTETFGIADATIHFGGAVVMLVINLMVTLTEYRAIARNSLVIEQIMDEVRKIRDERGLPAG